MKLIQYIFIYNQDIDLNNKEDFWKYSDGKFNISDTINNLQNYYIPIYIDVILIGFNGDGNKKIKLEKNIVQKYLSYTSLSKNIPYNVKENSNESLLLNRKYIYRVIHSDTNVCNTITDTLEYLFLY